MILMKMGWLLITLDGSKIILNTGILQKNQSLKRLLETAHGILQTALIKIGVFLQKTGLEAILIIIGKEELVEK